MSGRSLEDMRREAGMEIEAFAAHIGVTPDVYRRVLQGQASVATMRQIAFALGVELTDLIEFTPEASPALIRHLTAVVDRAEEGWLEADPETLMPTGQRVRESLRREPS